MADSTVESQGQVKTGPSGRTGNNIWLPQRAGPFGELITSQAIAAFYEAIRGGEVYLACNQSAITYGTALTATGVTFHLCNPIGSDVDLVLLHCGFTFASVTTGGQVVYAASGPHATAVTAGTALTVRNANGNANSGKGLAKSATTLPEAPVAVRAGPSLYLSVAATNHVAGQLSDNVNGALWVAPGGQLSIQGITIVATGLVSMTWAEVKRS